MSTETMPKASIETGMKQLLLLDELVVRTAHIEKYQREQIPDGVAEFTGQITIGPGTFTFDEKAATTYGLRGPWISVNVTNDGSVNLLYSVNDGVTKDMIQTGETREINMKAKGKLYQLVFFPTVATPIRLAFVR